jgi:hypothetical protein
MKPSESADSRGSGPLNRHAAKDLDSSRKVYEDLSVRNVTKRADLLPGVKVMPNQSDDAKNDRGQSIHVASEIDSRHFNPR